MRVSSGCQGAGDPRVRVHAALVTLARLPFENKPKLLDFCPAFCRDVGTGPRGRASDWDCGSSRCGRSTRSARRRVSESTWRHANESTTDNDATSLLLTRKRERARRQTEAEMTICAPRPRVPPRISRGTTRPGEARWCPQTLADAPDTRTPSRAHTHTKHTRGGSRRSQSVPELLRHIRYRLARRGHELLQQL